MRWINRSQPQTLVSATLLCYFSAVFLLIGSLVDAVTLLLMGAFVAGGLGTAAERRWGYWVCAAAAAYSTLATLWFGLRISFQLGVVMRLMFDVLLLALLFHPTSRNHRRVWFR